jgi:hypothetical protein
MPESFEAKWKEMYDLLGDGTIPECLGAECPNSCCGEKTASTIENPNLAHRTKLSPDEYLYQRQVITPAINDLDVRLCHATSPKTAGRPLYYLDRCQAEDGSCKLDGRKPLSCLVYPFGFEAANPIDRDCPAKAEIFNNRKIRNTILLVRDLLGLYDHDRWTHIARIFVPPKNGWDWTII